MIEVTQERRDASNALNSDIENFIANGGKVQELTIEDNAYHIADKKTVLVKKLKFLTTKQLSELVGTNVNAIRHQIRKFGTYRGMKPAVNAKGSYEWTPTEEFMSKRVYV